MVLKVAVIQNLESNNYPVSVKQKPLAKVNHVTLSMTSLTLTTAESFHLPHWCEIALIIIISLIIMMLCSQPLPT